MDRFNAYYDKISAADKNILKPHIIKKNINKNAAVVQQNLNDLKELAKNPSKLGLPKYDRVSKYFESLGGSRKMTLKQRKALIQALSIKISSLLAYVKSIKLGLGIK